MGTQPSLRAEIIARRTYCRIKPDGTSETWEESIDRVIRHQRALWQRASYLGTSGVWLRLDRMVKKDWLDEAKEAELEKLRQLLLSRKGMLAGRVHFLGGTPASYRWEASVFNCSFSDIQTPQDIREFYHLLLCGCGTGFEAKPGLLSGFPSFIPDIKIVRSLRAIDDNGAEDSIFTLDKGHFTLTVGDSAEGWSNAIAKLFTMPRDIRKLTVDLSQIRGAGSRLKGFGWVSSGDEPLSIALEHIIDILNKKSGEFLTHQESHDILNWLGFTLSSRRSAELSQKEYGSDGWWNFASCKPEGFSNGPTWFRCHANNSILFGADFLDENEYIDIPEVLRDFFDFVQASAGGAEPGMILGSTCVQRAPWFAGVNPCGEILLPSKGLCNLCEINVAAFDSLESLREAIVLIARANYRQAIAYLRDGILSEDWHLNNQTLKLCGVSLTGLVGSPHLLNPETLELLRESATSGANSMADELHLSRPKNVTTGKPSGTASKVMDAPGEGIHMPVAKYIINKVQFSEKDPLVPELRAAGYTVVTHPKDNSSVLVDIPYKYEVEGFETITVDGHTYEVDNESALVQLERYKLLMEYWCDQNMSITVRYRDEEIEDMIDWITENWRWIACLSFQRRIESWLPEVKEKTIKDFGYLPQNIITEQEYTKYANSLAPLTFVSSGDRIRPQDDPLLVCTGGACGVY